MEQRTFERLRSEAKIPVAKCRNISLILEIRGFLGRNFAFQGSQLRSMTIKQTSGELYVEINVYRTALNSFRSVLCTV